jgi:hypothetical protein
MRTNVGKWSQFEVTRRGCRKAVLQAGEEKELVLLFCDYLTILDIHKSHDSSSMLHIDRHVCRRPCVQGILVR